MVCNPKIYWVDVCEFGLYLIRFKILKNHVIKKKSINTKNILK